MRGMNEGEVRARMALLRAHRGNPAPLRYVLAAEGSVLVALRKGPALQGHVREMLMPLCVNADGSAGLLPPDEGFLQSADAQVLAADDDCYPPLLGEIHEPPPLLFCRGDVAPLSQPQLAIVGSRNASPAGLALARAFASDLAAAGFVITSGMALGIDAMAHEGALAAGGKTVAVLGCGADTVYPRRHASLAGRIRAQGCVVSEFMPGTPPLAPHFPLRNRIISALSLGVLVVEAAPDSGSLITARFAAEQGREVFAIPGSIHAPTSRGCHQLIREGATLVESSAQVLEALQHFALQSPGQMDLLQQQAAPTPAARSAPDEERLLRALSPAGCGVDQLTATTGLPAGKVLALLSALTISGQVHVLPGGLWQPAAPA